MGPSEPVPCDHHWVSMHQPGHKVYWILVCSICHEPNWDALDQEIGEKMQNFLGRARQEVYDYARRHMDETDKEAIQQFRITDVYIVWSVKVLQNWKCLVSTNLPDGMYYELTYNGEGNVIYFDAYKKFENFVIPVDPGEPGYLVQAAQAGT